MKILIKESKRNVLTKQMLNQKFPDLNVDEDDYKDSTGIHKRLSFDNGDGIIMVWSDYDVLYICDDVVNDLQIFSYTPDKLKDVVGQWFSETFDLPIGRIHLVSKELLN
jgi:hypothetical protein